jgi:hypothetical protein
MTSTTTLPDPEISTLAASALRSSEFSDPEPEIETSRSVVVPDAVTEPEPPMSTPIRSTVTSSIDTDPEPLTPRSTISLETPATSICPLPLTTRLSHVRHGYRIDDVHRRVDVLGCAEHEDAVSDLRCQEWQQVVLGLDRQGRRVTDLYLGPSHTGEVDTAELADLPGLGLDVAIASHTEYRST